MSAASVTAYLSPTIARNRGISSGESGGADGWTIFILVSCLFSCVSSFPPHRGAAQPVIDGFANPVLRHRHHRDGARAPGVAGAKITEKIGGALIEIAARGQIHHYGCRVNSRHATCTHRRQRFPPP